MSDDKPISLRSTSRMCTEIAEVVIDLLTDRLLAEAGGRDVERRYGQKGLVTLDDLIARLFEPDEGWAGTPPPAAGDPKTDG